MNRVRPQAGSKSWKFLHRGGCKSRDQYRAAFPAANTRPARGRGIQLHASLVDEWKLAPGRVPDRRKVQLRVAVVQNDAYRTDS